MKLFLETINKLARQQPAENNQINGLIAVSIGGELGIQ